MKKNTFQPPQVIPHDTAFVSLALSDTTMAVKLKRPDNDPHIYGVYSFSGVYQGALLTLDEVKKMKSN